VTTQNNTALCDCPTICTADWSPVCGSDNETYPNLCTMQVESCKTQQLITKASDGECSKLN
jgi:coxsackievirus/adenovirus receptor